MLMDHHCIVFGVLRLQEHREREKRLARIQVCEVFLDYLLLHSSFCYFKKNILESWKCYNIFIKLLYFVEAMLYSSVC